MSVASVMDELLQVELDLGLDGGTLRVGGRDVPYTGVTIHSPSDGPPTVTVDTVALGGQVKGLAAVTYRVEYVDTTACDTWPKAEGPSVPAALRALANIIEART